MKNENGGSKAIFIAIISVIVLAFFAVLLVFKFKGNGNKNGEAAAAAYTDTMTYIETTDSDYVFIDSNANVRKIKKDSIGSIAFNMNEGTVLYHNSILTKKDDKYVVVDFNGKTLYESDFITRLLQNKDTTLYQFEENGKYGIINAKGEVVVKPEHSEYFGTFDSSKISEYIYVVEYDSELKDKVLVIFDKDGNQKYKGQVEYGFTGNSAKCGKTRTGVNLITARKNETTINVINLNTGEEFNTVTDNNDHAIDIEIKGNCAVVKSYAKGTYGANQGDEITKYYWFGEDGKVSKTIAKAENESVYFWNGSEDEEYTIYTNASNEKIAINKYGKEVYKSTGSLSQRQFTNTITGVTTSYIIDSVGNNYKIIKEDGTTLFEGKLGIVGNKYVSSGTTLYKHDGTKYLENIKGYTSVYNLEIIKTADKIIIENQDGKTLEKDANYDLGNEAKLLNNDTVVLLNNKKLKVVNMNDLSMKELDFSSASYVFVRDGFITVTGKDSKYEYYNANGDKIYTRSPKK